MKEVNDFLVEYTDEELIKMMQVHSRANRSRAALVILWELQRRHEERVAAKSKRRK